MSQSFDTQQHPFLFQRAQYSSGDDGDSPPSLTNSSESPRSTSEELDHSSARFDSFDQNQTKDNLMNRQQSRSQQSAFDDQSSIKNEDLMMSPVQAATPSWDAIFASNLGADEMDLSASLGDLGDSQWKSIPENAVAQPTTSASKSIEEDLWGSSNVPHSYQPWTAASGDSKISDEAMFDSLIQEGSFE